jgi:hypothetical protein
MLYAGYPLLCMLFLAALSFSAAFVAGTLALPSLDILSLMIGTILAIVDALVVIGILGTELWIARKRDYWSERYERVAVWCLTVFVGIFTANIMMYILIAALSSSAD